VPEVAQNAMVEGDGPLAAGEGQDGHEKEGDQGSLDGRGYG
jgi:hypothetical protein